jgi:hypothetical protein
MTGFDSTMTASYGRLAASRGNAAASFAVVMLASLKACLNWLWISGSLLSNKMLNTEEESVMKAVTQPEEGRIIAQSRFDVNDEIPSLRIFT